MTEPVCHKNCRASLLPLYSSYYFFPSLITISQVRERGTGYKRKTTIRWTGNLDPEVVLRTWFGYGAPRPHVPSIRHDRSTRCLAAISVHNMAAWRHGPIRRGSPLLDIPNLSIVKSAASLRYLAQISGRRLQASRAGNRRHAYRAFALALLALVHTYILLAALAVDKYPVPVQAPYPAPIPAAGGQSRYRSASIAPLPL
ncbi:hypothetical protein GGR52DRAFT_6431 [Hypoxylon sp. FL1284]|nr:hypothetical protein GGR52DRAFT_6431 [Hypoxylon sp. FL1284]